VGLHRAIMVIGRGSFPRLREDGVGASTTTKSGTPMGQEAGSRSSALFGIRYSIDRNRVTDLDTEWRRART